MNLVEIGLRIKKCRRNQRITQEEFAEMIDVSPHYIYEIERGNKAMSLYTLDSVAAALHCSVDYILYGKNGTASSPDVYSGDRLEILAEQVAPHRRESVAEVLEFLLPYLK